MVGTVGSGGAFVGLDEVSGLLEVEDIDPEDGEEVERTRR